MHSNVVSGRRDKEEAKEERQKKNPSLTKIRKEQTKVLGFKFQLRCVIF